MKKTLLIVLVSTFTGALDGLMAQGLQVGIKGSLNSTWLVNKNISDAPTIEQDYVPSFGDSYGLSGAIYFTKKLGVEMNFLMSNHTQKNTDQKIVSKRQITHGEVAIFTWYPGCHTPHYFVT